MQRPWIATSLLTALSAVLIVLSFPPWGFYPLIWIALIPWFYALSRAQTTKQAFLQGLLLSFLMTVFGFYWVASVLHEFAEIPWWMAAVGLCLFALVGQPQFLAFGAVFHILKKKFSPYHHTLLWPLAAATLYTGIDWIIPKLWVDTLGHSLWKAERLRQAADLGGAACLTLVIYWTNDSLWRLLEFVRNKKKDASARAPLFHLGIAAFVIISLLVYGQFRRSQIRRLVSAAPKTLQIGVIQANIGDFDKVAAESGVQGASVKVLDKFFKMSDDALTLNPRPDALVWPETSYPTTFGTPSNMNEERLDESVEDYALSRRVSLLFGGYDHREGKDYNAFFFLSPTKDPHEKTLDLQVYRKNILLLFGEYIPLADTFTFLKTAFPTVGNFGRGIGPDALKIYPADPNQPPVLAGPVICYEALFPSYLISAARKGAQMILNITNDSWFGPYGEPILHFSLITFRSIETRLPQLRSTNTGISALILPDGTIQNQTEIDKEQIMNVTVPITPPIPTLMKTLGDWFGTFSILMGLVSLFLLRRKLNHSRKESL